MTWIHPFFDPKVDPRISKLFAYGHFENPDHPTEVKEKDLPKLKLKDKAVKEAVQSYQEYFSQDLHHIAKEVHGRLAEPDGDLGPATSILLDMPRCGAPDYAGREEARWGDDCKDDLTFSYFFDEIDATIARYAFEGMIREWNIAVEITLRLIEQFSRDTRIWATDGPLSGSILAWAMLAIGRCNWSSEERYNSRVNWSRDQLKSTAIHEVGHSLGLQHINSRSAIMYPSIVGHQKPQPLDIEAMVRLGYKKRTGPVPPPDPPPDPPPPGPFPGGWVGKIDNVSTGQTITLLGLPS